MLTPNKNAKKKAYTENPHDTIYCKDPSHDVEYSAFEGPVESCGFSPFAEGFEVPAHLIFECLQSLQLLRN